MAAGWRHWVTKYTDKESMHNPQHCYISHNYPYKGCVKCSNVVECALLVRELCHPMPPSGSHPYIW